MYLLDTNVVSELRRPRPHGGVVKWLESVAEGELHLSAVTLGEIQAGIELTREQDPTKSEEIERWADLLAGAYNVLPMDVASFRLWAKLMHGRSDTLYEDAMIAATAQQHGLVVVTRNVADFRVFRYNCSIRSSFAERCAVVMRRRGGLGTWRNRLPLGQVAAGLFQNL